MNRTFDTIHAGAAQMPGRAERANSGASPAAADHPRGSMNRREPLRTLAAGGAAGLVTAGAVVATGPAVAVHDPLLAMINALKAEEAVCYAIEDDDEHTAAYEARLCPIIDRIIHETPPATTAAGALAALERVHYGMTEAGPGVYDEALLKAAMAYLEGRAA